MSIESCSLLNSKDVESMNSNDKNMGVGFRALVSGAKSHAQFRARMPFFVIIITILGAFIASIPFLQSGIAGGNDISFHLARIESISKGLSQGIFPVRLYESQAYGYGYPTGACYPYFFLYIPAILRLLGVPLNYAYMAFVITINVCTALIAVHSFSRVFSSWNVGALCGFLWTVAPYRLVDIVCRAALGEALALMFAPLLVFGLWSVLVDDSTGRGWLWLGVSMAGVVNSHLLSIILFALPLFPLAIVLLVMDRSKFKFLSLVKALAVALILSAGFVVPFIGFYRSNDLLVQHTQQIPWVYALEPAQLFEFAPELTGRLNAMGGQISGEPPQNVGWAILLALPLWFVVSHASNAELSKTVLARLAKSSLIIALALMIMATYLFPWKGLTQMGPLSMVLSKVTAIQFPMRLLGPIELMLVIVIGCAFRVVEDHDRYGFVLPDPQLARAIPVLLFAVALVESGHAVTTYIHNSERLSVDKVTELFESEDPSVAAAIGLGEYLPSDMSRQDLVDIRTSRRLPETSSTDIRVSFCDLSNAQSVSLTAANDGESEGSVLLPFIWHSQNRLIPEEGMADQPYRIEESGGLTRLVVPGGTTGKVKIVFEEPLVWTASELVSDSACLLLIITGLVFTLRERRGDPCQTSQTQLPGKEFYTDQV